MRCGSASCLMFCWLASACSLGTVRLRSLDAGDLVDIDARTHSHPADRVRYLEAMRQALRMFETPTIRNMTYGGTVDPSPQVVAGGDAALWHWIKQNCDGTNGHPQGTCRMGPREEQAPYGPRNVVDQRLRVYGVSGLRVVDASVHPAPFHVSGLLLLLPVASTPSCSFSLRATRTSRLCSWVCELALSSWRIGEPRHLASRLLRLRPSLKAAPAAMLSR